MTRITWGEEHLELHMQTPSRVKLCAKCTLHN
jgi:hypothetical protein